MFEGIYGSILDMPAAIRRQEYDTCALAPLAFARGVGFRLGFLLPL